MILTNQKPEKYFQLQKYIHNVESERWQNCIKKSLEFLVDKFVALTLGLRTNQKAL